MPMLAQNVEPTRLSDLLADPAWVLQPKLDGDRVLVEVHDGQVRAYGRNGKAKVSNVTPAMLAPFKVFPGQFVFDGEVVGRVLHLFDLPLAEGIVEHKTPFVERYTVLQSLVEVLGVSHVQVVDLAVSEDEKIAMLAGAQAGNKEGVMFRRAASRYVAGRSHDLLKHKFVKTIDCVVTGVRTDGKNSALLSVFTGEEYGDEGGLLEVGKVSTLGKGAIQVGQVVEVRYLYITDPEAPRLYQPRIVKVRTDKSAAECTTEQLVGAVTSKTV